MVCCPKCALLAQHVEVPVSFATLSSANACVSLDVPHNQIAHDYCPKTCMRCHLQLNLVYLLFLALSSTQACEDSVTGSECCSKLETSLSKFLSPHQSSCQMRATNTVLLAISVTYCLVQACHSLCLCAPDRHLDLSISLSSSQSEFSSAL